MKFNFYSIRDRLMGIYLAPFTSRGDVDAVRQVKMSFSNPEIRHTPIYASSHDYDLFCVGSFDDESGEVSTIIPILISNLEKLKPDDGSSTVSS